MDDMDQFERCHVERDANFLARFTDDRMSQRFAAIKVARDKAVLAIHVTSVASPDHEDSTVGLQQQIDGWDDLVLLIRHVPRPFVPAAADWGARLTRVQCGTREPMARILRFAKASNLAIRVADENRLHGYPGFY
jgi:hypothetical protein